MSSKNTILLVEHITEEINDSNIKQFDTSSFYQPNEAYLGGVEITLYAVWKKGDNGNYMNTSDSDKHSDNLDTNTEKETDTGNTSDDSEEPVPDKPLYGDVDCNGVVNMEDVVALQKIMAKLTTHEAYGEKSRINSDCTHEGDVNMVDVTEIQKFLAKLIPDLDP